MASTAPSPTVDASRPLDAAPIVRLLISCEDRQGIVAAASGLLDHLGANIVTSDQFSTGVHGGRFFMRMQFALPPESDQAAVEASFAPVAERFGMNWKMWRAGEPKRVAVLVSRYDHCLLDLLWRWRRGELEADIGLVVSNHRALEADVHGFGLPFHHVPVEKGSKPEAEATLLDLLAGKFELIVLARYMQILSGQFLADVGAPVINIHHSFLPAFAGAGPYERAKERGVKLIGATSHYVTEELDAGPIIEQDVVRVDHSGSATELERQGADIERSVLGRAVKWHCEDRVLIDGGTTVVF
ncbi:MAG TPA: formyltetrahydrofolate deformylase [Solirubrobacterales bacterium]|jgi:formyltetrahydrofolate deformylase